MSVAVARVAASAVAAGTAIILLAPASAAATATTTAVKEPDATLTMKGMAFSKPVTRVAVGDTVTWTNNDTTVHLARSAASAPAAFASPRLAVGKSWSHTFTKPGRYTYVCTLHPGMKATIVAVAAPGGEAAVTSAAKQAGTTAAAAGATQEITAAGTAAQAEAEAEATEAASEIAAGVNSAPLLAGSAAFVALLALMARATRRPEV